MRFHSALLAAVSLLCVAAPVAAGAAAPASSHHRAQVKHRAAAKHRQTPSGLRGISVVMDQVRIVTFTRPIATVFVGNPLIADATVIDPYHAFVLGKTFGVTNLIALGAQSQTVANQQITVANRAGGVVTLNKGSAQFNYSCTVAHCETNPLPGDQKTYFDDSEGAISTHQDQSIKAASAAAPH